MGFGGYFIHLETEAHIHEPCQLEDQCTNKQDKMSNVGFACLMDQPSLDQHIPSEMPFANDKLMANHLSTSLTLPKVRLKKRARGIKLMETREEVCKPRNNEEIEIDLNRPSRRT